MILRYNHLRLKRPIKQAQPCRQCCLPASWIFSSSIKSKKRVQATRFWYYCTSDISSTSLFKELTPRTQRREHDAGPRNLHVFQVVATFRRHDSSFGHEGRLGRGAGGFFENHGFSESIESRIGIKPSKTALLNDTRCEVWCSALLGSR